MLVNVQIRSTPDAWQAGLASNNEFYEPAWSGLVLHALLL